MLYALQIRLALRQGGEVEVLLSSDIPAVSKLQYTFHLFLMDKVPDM